MSDEEDDWGRMATSNIPRADGFVLRLRPNGQAYAVVESYEQSGVYHLFLRPATKEEKAILDVMES